MSAPKLDLSDNHLLQLIELVYRHTGITMTEKKESMIRTRLRSRMRELKLLDLGEYVHYLETHTNEIEHFVNLITTNETSFFRTPRIWDYFNDVFLQDWMQNHSGECLNIWSAAASTGEEAYSISMSCLERGITNFKILGTDISTEVLQAASQGIYSGRNAIEFNHKFPELKKKYFDDQADSIRIKRILKERVTFQPHNLFTSLKSPIKFDIIFLRNVLIYFKNQDQEKVIKVATQNLKKGGVLVLGESESISRFETNLKYKSPLIYTNE